MPFDAYDCLACGETFDKLLHISEADQLPVCPKCASVNTQKKLPEVVAAGADSANLTNTASSSSGSGECLT